VDLGEAPPTTSLIRPPPGQLWLIYVPHNWSALECGGAKFFKHNRGMKAVHYHGRDGVRVSWQVAPSDFCNLRSAFFFANGLQG
jgi:hypothetical protein